MSQFDIATAMDKMMEIGAEHGVGRESLQKAARVASRMKAPHSAAADLYKAWCTGSNSQSVNEDEIEARKVAISCFGTFLHPAVEALGDKLWNRVLTTRAAIPADNRAASAYNSLVACNRLAKKLDRMPNDAELRAKLVKAEKEEKDLFDYLDTLEQAAEKVGSKFGVDTNSIVLAVQQLIAAKKAELVNKQVPANIEIAEHEVPVVDILQGLVPRAGNIALHFQG